MAALLFTSFGVRDQMTRMALARPNERSQSGKPVGFYAVIFLVQVGVGSAMRHPMSAKKNTTQELSRRAILLQHDYQIFLDGRASSPELATLFAEKAHGKISAGQLGVHEIVLELGEQPQQGLNDS
jgi:hypothetical protein